MTGVLADFEGDFVTDDLASGTLVFFSRTGEATTSGVGITAATSLLSTASDSFLISC